MTFFWSTTFKSIDNRNILFVEREYLCTTRRARNKHKNHGFVELRGEHLKTVLDKLNDCLFWKEKPIFKLYVFEK